MTASHFLLASYFYYNDCGFALIKMCGVEIRYLTNSVLIYISLPTLLHMTEKKPTNYQLSRSIITYLEEMVDNP